MGVEAALGFILGLAFIPAGIAFWGTVAVGTATLGVGVADIMDDNKENIEIAKKVLDCIRAVNTFLDELHFYAGLGYTLAFIDGPDGLQYMVLDRDGNVVHSGTFESTNIMRTIVNTAKSSGIEVTKEEYE